VSANRRPGSNGDDGRTPGSPHEIHVVSRVLLRRFADPATRKLAGYHLASRKEYEKSPRSVGWVEQFIKYRPEETEAERKTTVEDRLNDAFEALDNGTIFCHPAHVDTIKGCMALHWARSKAYKELHESLLEAGRQWHKQHWREQYPQLLAAAFVSKYGLYPAGPEALDHIHDLLYEPPAIIASGEFFASRVRSLISRSRDYFKTQRSKSGESAERSSY